MTLENVIFWGRGFNVCTLADVSLGGSDFVLRVPRGYRLLAGFVGLRCAEDKFIRI